MLAYYDRTGWPITLKEWAHLSENAEYRRIGSDHVGALWVSTVWLGLDHSMGVGPPLIFETMVFDATAPTEVVIGPRGEAFELNHQWDDCYQQRYTTEEQACRGHLATVARLRQETSND